MPERIQLHGPTEKHRANSGCTFSKKTMLDVEKLHKFTIPEAAAHFMPEMSRDSLVSLNTGLIVTLVKMRIEHKEIFEKNSALEDDAGKLCKEKISL